MVKVPLPKARPVAGAASSSKPAGAKMKGKQGRQNKAASVTRAEKQAMAQTLALLDRGVHERAAGCTKEKLDMVRQALTMRNVPRPGPPPDLVLALRDAIAEDAVLIECCNLGFIGQHGSRNCEDWTRHFV